MCYADSCYILALILKDDVWKANAENIRAQILAGRHTVLACETTFIELLFDAGDRRQDPVRYMRDALELVQCDLVAPETILRAAVLIRDKGMGVSDAMIASHAVEARCRLITSDLGARPALKTIEGLQLINLRSPSARV